ncbi:MAG: hypothetical protein A2Y77_03405 [Planctomycetes bacterium RBG_13_62_9]|nr:MAG: hypothetical protein A2Y77_03405 [Planctomycetes bacterium RBG_13_62_9]
MVRRAGSRLARTCRNRYERLYYRRFHPMRQKRWDLAPGGHLLGLGQDPARAIALYRRLFPDAAAATIRRAEAICDHVFDLLGSGPTRLSPAGPPYQPVDWHTDFKSRYTWDRAVFFREVRYGHIPGIDIRVPWELSRFQHLSTLGQAYALTADPKYAAEFANQIDDWLRSNPMGFGVNWACTMDVAIRAANWLTAAEYFRASGVLEPGFLNRLYSSVYAHGQFIYRHLEDDAPRANHYLANVVGLLFIAAYCPFFRESDRWFRFALGEVCREMTNQVYADGCHFEASTCYHRLVLELFFLATRLAATRERGSSHKNGRQAAEEVFGAEYVERLHRMFVAVLHLLKPDGRMPQIGDNDSGRFQVFGFHDVLDMRYLLALGAVFFEEPQLKVREFGCSEDVLWLFGTQGYAAWQAMEGRSVEALGSRSFPEAGWHVLRRGREYCLVSCGRNGPAGRGGHAHNDKLSIELASGGRDVVVDPGTYTYTADPDRRNRFRSTGYHNTVRVEEHEQNGPLNGDVFTLPDHVVIRRAQLAEGAGRACFEGRIEYAGIVHERTVSLEAEPGRWRIEDRVSCRRPIQPEASFHLSPRAISRDACILDKEDRSVLARLDVEGGRMSTRDYDYSPRYGVSTPAQCVSVRATHPTHVAAITTVFCTPRGERA